MGRTSVGNLASELMNTLNEYASATTEGVKTAVSRTGKTVKNEIKANAPVGSGTYAKSWSVKKTRENSNSLDVTVYSPKRYWQAHLLEHGHAKRNGGRVSGKEHIAPAEQTGIEMLEREIERCIRNG